jgi:hypothetical protein
MLEFDYTNVLDSSAGPHGIPQGAFEKAAKSSHLATIEASQRRERAIVR